MVVRLSCPLYSVLKYGSLKSGCFTYRKLDWHGPLVDVFSRKLLLRFYVPVLVSVRFLWSDISSFRHPELHTIDSLTLRLFFVPLPVVYRGATVN